MRPFRNKYGAKRTRVGQVTYDSKAEAGRAQELAWLERAGEITQLEEQPRWDFPINGNLLKIRSARYQNGRTVTYRADFAYRDKTGELVVEDVKGMDTEGSRLRRALMEAVHGIQVRVVKKVKR